MASYATLFRKGLFVKKILKFVRDVLKQIRNVDYIKILLIFGEWLTQ